MRLTHDGRIVVTAVALIIVGFGLGSQLKLSIEQGVALLIAAVTMLVIASRDGDGG